MKQLNIYLALFLLFFSAHAHAKVEPLLRTQWAQTNPYNAFCPQGKLAGCVAIAMAQIMNYHQYPAHGIGKNSYKWNNQKLSADFQNTWYRWEDMDNLNPSAAQLIYHCGVAVWMDYSSSFSGSNEYYAKSALTDYFGYSNDILLRSRNQYDDEAWKQLLSEDLDRGWPIIYSSGGHTFVVDGYNDEGKFHANMGFGPGGGNRYYTIEELGNRANSTALVHIHPAKDDLAPEAQQLVVFLNDASSYALPCAKIKSLSTDGNSTLLIEMLDNTSSSFELHDITYMNIH